ncbi:hypothetical protein Y032_0472g2073 [Ancylostoma ceylanicum]|uniref:Uncharacterized protein n=1 Tax=Ancylostoma ceylanicum TaxID=53326 RepID=A0A016WYN0_9BILA|nr:hypothetical protein Y032_0472g2073 [Ancylostoma ceylanicum]
MRQLTLPRWVVWRSGRVHCVPFTGFRDGTHAHPAAEHSSAPSTHGKQRLPFLLFSLLLRSSIHAYEFTVPKNSEIRGNLQRKDFCGFCLQINPASEDKTLVMLRSHTEGKGVENILPKDIIPIVETVRDIHIHSTLKQLRPLALEVAPPMTSDPVLFIYALTI